MGKGGTGLSSCANAWSGVAVTSKKDRHLIATGSLSSMVLSRKCARAYHMRLTETTAELGRASGQTAIVGKPVSDEKTAGFRRATSLLTKASRCVIKVTKKHKDITVGEPILEIWRSF